MYTRDEQERSDMGCDTLACCCGPVPCLVCPSLSRILVFNEVLSFASKLFQLWIVVFFFDLKDLHVWGKKLREFDIFKTKI